MSVLHQIENEIIQWLQPLGKQYNVGIEELTAYSLKRVIQHHQIYVNYDRRSFDYPNFTDTPIVEDISYDVFIRFVDLRSHDSAYPLLDAIVNRLSEFESTEVEVTIPLRITEEQFLSDMVDDGIWVYRQKWQIQIQNCC